MRGLGLAFAGVLAALWTARAEATFYYVSKTGSNSNTGTTAGTAFLTITKAMSVAVGGDIVYVGSGTYSETLTSVRAGTGTTGRIRIIGDVDGTFTGSAAGTVTVTSASTNVISLTHDYIEFEWMTIDGGSTSGVNVAVTSGVECALRNCVLTNAVTNGAAVSAGKLTLDSCTIVANVANQPGRGVYSSSSGQLNVVASTISGCGTAGVYIFGTGACVIDRNTLTQNGSYGVVSSNTATIQVSNNIITGSSTSSGSGVYCLAGTLTIANNTIYNLNFGINNALAGTVTARNNILDRLTTGIYYANFGGSLTNSNNLYYLCGTNLSGVASGGGDVTSDPRLVNPPSDCRLQAGSPAINAGVTVAGITAVDRAWVPRPQGASWDMGAYEVPSATGTMPYAATFESGTAGSEWASSAVVTSATQTKFTGPFGNATQGVRLNTTAGVTYTVTFDAYMMASWDGSGTGSAPDYFVVRADGAALGRWTHMMAANTNTNFSWPDIPEIFTGNYYSGNAGWPDALYRRVSLDFTATGSQTYLTWTGENLQGWSDEGWGIDNVMVTTAANSGINRPRFNEVGRFLGFDQVTSANTQGLAAGDFRATGKVGLLQAVTSATVVDLGQAGGFGAVALGVGATGQTALLDANNDGYLDIAMADSSLTNGARFVTGSASAFTTAGTMLSAAGTVSGTKALAAMDVNGDGICDLVMFGSSGNIAMLGALSAGSPAVLSYALSTATFPNTVSDRTSGGFVATGDINNDGYPDVFYNAYGGIFFVSNGDGTYSRATLGISPGLTATDRNGAVLVDLDNDGILELVCGNRSGSLTVWKRTSTTGNFSNATSTFGLSSITNVCGISAGDFNNSGSQSLILTRTTGNVQLWKNSGYPSYTFTKDDLQGVSTECSGGDVMFADYNMDGNLDVALTYEAGSRMSRLYRNNGAYVPSGGVPPANSSYLFVRVLGKGASGINKAGIGARVELWDAAGTTLLQRRDIGSARGLGGQDMLWAHFGGVDAATTYTLKVFGGARAYSVQVVPGTVSTTIGSTVIPQMFTFDESTIATIRVTRWREVTSDQ